MLYEEFLLFFPIFCLFTVDEICGPEIFWYQANLIYCMIIAMISYFAVYYLETFKFWLYLF